MEPGSDKSDVRERPRSYVFGSEIILVGDKPAAEPVRRDFRDVDGVVAPRPIRIYIAGPGCRRAPDIFGGCFGAGIPPEGVFIEQSNGTPIPLVRSLSLRVDADDLVWQGEFTRLAADRVEGTIGVDEHFVPSDEPELVVEPVIVMTFAALAPEEFAARRAAHAEAAKAAIPPGLRRALPAEMATVPIEALPEAERAEIERAVAALEDMPPIPAGVIAVRDIDEVG